MGVLRDLFIRIKGDNSGANKAIDETKGKVGGLGAGVKGMTAAFAAAAAAGAAAFAAIITVAKNTDFGLEAINKTLSVTKQLLNDLVLNKSVSFGNLKEAARISGEQSKINEDNAEEAYRTKRMQSELNKLIVEASDQTLTHSQRLALLTKAMEKEKELKAFLLKDARKELQVAKEAYDLNKFGTKEREAFWAAMSKVAEIQGMDSKRLMSQYTGELVAQKKYVEDLADAFTEVAQSIEEVKKAWGNGIIAQTSNLTTGTVGSKAGNKLAGGPQTYAGSQMVANAMGDQAEIDAANTQMMIASEKFQEDWSAAWQDTIGNVVNTLEEGFIGAFQALGEGSLDGLGKNMLGAMGNLVADLGKMLVALGTTWLTALNLIQAPTLTNAIAAIAAGGVAMAIGGMMIGASKRAGDAMESGNYSSSGGGYSGGQSGVNQMKIVFEGKIKGKDIYFTQQRYLEEN